MVDAGAVLDRLLRDDGFRRRPHAAYRQLAEDGVAALPGKGEWLVACHRDAIEVLQRAPTTTKPDARTGGATRQPTDELLFLDPPDHTRLRKVAARALAAPEARALRRTIGGSIDRRVEELSDGRPVEVLHDLALAVPVAAISAVLGFPPEVSATVEAWFRGVVALTLGTSERAEEVWLLGDDARSAVTDVLAHRRLHPGHDGASVLAAAATRGEVTEREAASLAIQLFVAGHETTMNALANATWLLAASPNALQAVSRRPELADRAVTEMLRLEGPVHMVGRVATAPFVLGGQAIGAGDALLVLVAAANRDPMAFPDPDDLRLDREGAEPLPFGAGEHRCPGSSLARLQIREVVLALARRVERVHLDVDPVMRPDLAVRGPLELSVRLEPRSSLVP